MTEAGKAGASSPASADSPPEPAAAAAPRESAQVYSAHKTIAIFRGVDDENVAHFEIATYLRYARADGERAEDPRRELALELGTADAHTAMLADEADGGALSRVVAALAPGARVELEWLQMRLPGAAEGEVARVCPKLACVSEAEEAALVARFCRPRPPPPGVCAPCAAGPEPADLISLRSPSSSGNDGAAPPPPPGALD